MKMPVTTVFFIQIKASKIVICCVGVWTCLCNSLPHCQLELF